MARVRAVIDLNYDEAQSVGRLSKIITNQYTNNVSKHPHTNEIVTTEYSLTDMEKNSGTEVAPFNYTKFSDNKRFLADGKYNGYMYGLTDAEGNYDLELTLYGVNLFQLTFYFDEVAGQYPTNYKVTYLDGSTEEFENSSNSITITFQANTDENLPQKVLFYKWSRTNYNASITFIGAKPTTLNISSAWIENLESTSELTFNGETINYGALSNTGSIEMIDINNTLRTYAEYGYLDMNVFNVKLYFNDKIISQHYASDSPYYDEDKSFKVNLTNQIELWSNIECPERVYSTATNLATILVNIFGDSLGYTRDEVYSMLNNYIYVNDGYKSLSVLYYLQYISVPSFTLKKDSLLNNVNKVCDVAQLFCVEDNNGKIKFYNARPVITATQAQQVLKIDSDLQQEKPTMSILVSNRYDGVIIE